MLKGTKQKAERWVDERQVNIDSSFLGSQEFFRGQKHEGGDQIIKRIAVKGTKELRLSNSAIYFEAKRLIVY